MFSLLGHVFKRFGVEMADDEFVDASDTVVGGTDMVNGIRAATLAQDLFFQNKYEDAFATVEPYVSKSIYHQHALTSLNVLNAIMTFDEGDFKKGQESADRTIKMCDALLKDSFMTMMTDTFDSNKYKNWSDERFHALLVRAESIIYKTAMTVLSSGTDILAIAAACLNIRESYKILEKCQTIGMKKDWKSNFLKDEFKYGAKFGLGVYQLYLSVLPPKILKILEWVGFRGDRDEGLRLLYEAADSNACRSLFAKWFPMFYYYMVQYFMGTVGEKEGTPTTQTDAHLKIVSEMFPGGVVVDINRAQRCIIGGKVAEAIPHMHTKMQGWKNFEHFLFWQLYWCHGMLGDFTAAAEYSEKLMNESKWSPAIYTFMHALALLGIGDSKSVSEAGKLLGKIEGLRQKIAGKSIPDEKFVARKAKGYVNGTSKMPFGFLELAYFFNYTKMGNFNSKIAQFWLSFIQKEEAKIAEGHEDKGVAMLMKSIFYAQSDRYVEAAGQAQVLLKKYKKPKVESYLPPCATFELGNALRLQGKPDEAIKCFDQARTDFTGYYVESRLHFRCHTFKQLIQHKPKTSL